MVFGYNCVKDGVEKGQIVLVLLASDLSEKSTERMTLFLDSKNVEYMTMEEEMIDISNCAGKYSGILGVKNREMALRLKEIKEDCSGRNSSYDKIQSI